MHTILILDDNQSVLTSLSILFNLNGYTCLTTTSPTHALIFIERENISLVIADMNFQKDTTSGEEGKRFFYTARNLLPDLPIILITGWADIATAVELVKAGAADYLPKPWDDNKLLTSVKNLLEITELNHLQKAQQYQRQVAREALATNYELAGLVYESDAIHELLLTAMQIAKADVPVLITGANGSGKEKIAEIIQRNSSVQRGPFIKVNAGALPIELMEAEIFGAEAGAFTGIQKTRIGHFEMADGGTLFLDEIGNLPISGQIKLLRVLQSGEFQRLGSSQIRRAKVRLITATNTDLSAAIVRGEFREDLFYRLNLIELRLPPLHQRKEDIIPLARYFLQGRPISIEALRTLEAYDWPGNVRELQNTIKRASLLAHNPRIETNDLQLPDSIKSKARPLFEPNESQLRTALQNTTSVAAAARTLGLSRQALYRRLDKFGIHAESAFGESE